MDTTLYCQSPLKTSAMDKVTGVRRYAAAADWHEQAVEGIPSRKAFAWLAKFWRPRGAIIECGSCQVITTDLFAELHTVYLDHNPRTNAGRNYL